MPSKFGISIAIKYKNFTPENKINLISQISGAEEDKKDPGTIKRYTFQVNTRNISQAGLFKKKEDF